MKIIFLDVDGVITTPPKWLISIDKIRLLKRIVDETGAKIVLSSSWRCDTVSETISRLQRGIDIENEYMTWLTNSIYDVTPIKNTRGEEIKDWLDSHDNIENYVIIDDDSDMLDEQLFHFVQTNFEDGITDTIAVRAIKVLNRYFIQNPIALNYELRYQWRLKCDNMPNRKDEIWKYDDIYHNVNNIYVLKER